ncbi:Glycine receptor subunit alpha-3 [Dermatophagoides pteronyssinus]|uniref:Glycine receptor subunit alpha-3 n=1 Tax=Dermatophagoides pteronyssinus TaxID=6956 RepID=A0ABQ8JUY4_DERPT|nr:Glycine receptor subunit alpha-3 [Dermatophagoides pteronyssinus]
MDFFPFPSVKNGYFYVRYIIPLKGKFRKQNEQTNNRIVQSQADIRQVEKKILDKIIGEGYDSRIRPSGSLNQTVTKRDGPANVTINILIRSISSIDDVTMKK